MERSAATAGQERWLADPGIGLIRGTGKLAGPGVVEVDGVRHTAEHVVVATGSDPVIPPVPGSTRAKAVLLLTRSATGFHFSRTDGGVTVPIWLVASVPDPGRVICAGYGDGAAAGPSRASGSAARAWA